MENKNNSINSNVTAVNNLVANVGTLEAVTDTLEAISDYIFKQLMVARDLPDVSEDTIALLTEINNKVFRLCERGKIEATLAAN